MSSSARDSNINSQSSTIATPDVPNIGWYGLIMNKRQELIAYCQETLIQLQRVSAQWQDQIPIITVFIGDMSHKLEQLQRVHPDARSQSIWSQFFAELKSCVNDLNTFTLILADKTNTTPQIIAAFVERIKTWPELIKAFNNLELDLIANGLFSSFSAKVADMEERASAFSLKSALPPYHFKQLEDSISWLEKNLGESFSSYPQTMQDVILISASELNVVFLHAYLMIDKFASQMDFETQKLVEEPIFNIGSTPHQEEEKGVPTGTLSFHQLATRFREMYSTFLTKAGYDWHEEYYPFTGAILTQRKAYPMALSQQQALEMENENQRWKKAQLECITIIEARVRELQDEYANMWRSGHAKKENIKQLEELINHLPTEDVDIEIAIHQCIKTPDHDDVKATLQRIRSVYSNAAARKNNRQAWFAKQKQNFEELIAQARTNNSKQPSIRPHPSTMSELMSTEAPALVNHTQQLLSTFIRPDNNQQSNETLFDTILNTIQQCELKFQELLDPAIFADLFEKDTIARNSIKLKFGANAEGKYDPDDDLVQTEIEVNHSWMFNLAQLVKKIKLMAIEAKKLQSSSLTENKAGITPGIHFRGTVRQLDATVVSLTALMKRFNELRDHPIVKALPPIGTMLGMAIPTIQEKLQQTIVQPLSNHPAQQAWNEKEDYAAASDKLSGGLQHLRRIFLSLLDQSDKDLAMKQIANHGLGQADELLDAFQNTKSIMAFLFNQPRQLYRFIKSVADIFSSLMTLSGDQLLLAAKKMNDALRLLFVLFDKLEIQFYLKENYFANLISVNNQTLLALGKTFSDTMKDQGYVFNSDECFPYTQAILAQRRQLLSAAVYTDPLTEKFITARITKAVNEIAAGQTQVEAAFSAGKAAFKVSSLQKLSARRLALINANATACIPSSTKTKKADLLDRVITNLRDSNAITIKLGMFTDQERRLLLSGETGDLLKSLLFYTKEHFIADVRNLTDKLRSQQQASCGLFSYPLIFLKKINAIAALQSWLELPGYRIDDAMKELKEHDYASYLILDKNKKELINPLKALEKYIPDFIIGKKVIGLTGNIMNAENMAASDQLPAGANESLFDDVDAPAQSLYEPLLSHP
jgi:hypothetical protein